MQLWRLSRHESLNGEGGRRYGARWHSAGSLIVYLAESPPGALVEILVHLELDESELPPAYKLLRVTAPDKVRISQLRIPAGDAWKSNLALTRRIGDAWLKSRRSALARVPSAILPNTFNYLLNPLHLHAARVTIAEVRSATIDPRLIR
jgi:RES domain-containing protein